MWRASEKNINLDINVWKVPYSDEQPYPEDSRLND